MKPLLLLLLCYLALGYTGTSQVNLSQSDENLLVQRLEKSAKQHAPDLKEYCEELLKRDITDSLRAAIYIKLGDVYYTTISYNLDSAINNLKSGLKYSVSPNKNNRIICLDRLSQCYILKNENDKAISHYAEMIKLVEEHLENDVDKLKAQPRKYSIFFYLGDIESSVTGALKCINDITSYLNTNSNLPKKVAESLIEIRIYLYTELLNYYNYQKKLGASAFYINKLQKLENEGHFIPFGIWYQKTFYYILSGKYDDALNELDAAQNKYINGSKIDTYQAFYYRALCWQKKGSYQKSMSYCDSAIKYMIMMPSFFNYELEIYRIYFENAQKLNNHALANKYSQKYFQLSEAVNYASKAQYVAKLYDAGVVEPLTARLKVEAGHKKLIYYTGGFLLIAAALLCFKIFQYKRDKKRFEAIIAQLSMDKMETQLPATGTSEPVIEKVSVVIDEKESIPELSKKKNEISIETEKEILNKLNEFEENNKFLDAELSLSSLSAMLNTNATYLSHVVKKYKKNNFTAYINEKRTDYIILKLKNDPPFRGYKISYLAQVAGFASHAAFSRVFLDIKGITPSKFIEFLEKPQK